MASQWEISAKKTFGIFNYKGEDVVAISVCICRQTGCQKTTQVDNGSELVSWDMDLWAYQRGVTLDLSGPGKPTDNAYIDAFNSKLRSECLNANWFVGLEDNIEKLDSWRRDYNAKGRKAPLGTTPQQC